MKNSTLALMSILTFTIILLSSCSEDDNLICTTDFKEIKLTVVGDSLTEYYTIRLSNNDTLKAEYGPYLNHLGGYDYTVADDGLRSELSGKVEMFLFIGKIGDVVVVSEEFEIGGGDCHIYKKSGKEKIALGTPEE